MEMCDDGPIIWANSCLNCIHSVEHRGGIACGDRGALLRMLLGLRLIENPNSTTCNRFEPIPKNITKNCRFCKHFGPHHESTACWNVDTLTLLLTGPYIRMADDKCHDFELANQFKKRNFNPEKQR